VSNGLAVLVQYLSAKLGIATGCSLPRMCRAQFSRRTSLGLWLQAEAVALATDLAEVLGGAVALQLLFGMPVLLGGIVTGAVSFLLLALQTPQSILPFQRVITGLIVVIAIGFAWSALSAPFQAGDAVAGLVPRFGGGDSVVVAAGMLGATVMPHAIYLHSAIMIDRFEPAMRSDPGARRRLVRATRVDVAVAMAVAGGVNLLMLLLAAGALRDARPDTLEGVHSSLESILGAVPALTFAVALLASGLASSAVGTYAGAVILEGFLGRRMPLPARRLVTLVPAVGLVALGLDPTAALVISQVVLSFGIPFALVPLVRFTADRSLMGSLVNRRLTTIAGTATAGVVSGLNIVLIGLTIGSLG
jgi:manganese transport protein